MKGALLILWLSVAHIVAYSQVAESTDTDEMYWEELFGSMDPEAADAAGGQLLEQLQELEDHPVNINRAALPRLLELPGLRVGQAREIIAYRDRAGPFERITDLDKVAGIGPATVQRVRPYVTVGSQSALMRRGRYWTSGGGLEFTGRYRQILQRQEGYRRADSSGFRGGPGHLFHKWHYRSEHLSMHLVQEKDPGEPISGKLGFDYTSWHLAARNVGALRALVAGDYDLAFGQGLVFGNAGGPGKSSSVIGSPVHRARGVHPYTSASEAGYLRGFGATVGRKLVFSGFLSLRQHSATVVGPDTTRFPSASGLHRTFAERQKISALQQALAGGRIGLNYSVGELGVTGYRTGFSRYILPSSRPGNRYAFRGRTLGVLGADFNLTIGRVQLAGEAARSGNGAIGALTVVRGALADDVDVAMLWRNYQQHFHSMFGRGFGEQTGAPRNERGIYFGLRYRSGGITVRGFMDQFQFPAARYAISRPGSGFDWLFAVAWDYRRQLELEVMARGERKSADYPGQGEMGFPKMAVNDRRHLRFRIQATYRVGQALRWRGRLETVSVRRPAESGEAGILLFHDLRYRFANSWLLDVRCTLFDTESYDSRMYQFENDLRYLFTNTALFGQGERIYLLLRYRHIGRLDISVKYGITTYENQLRVGSGLSQIDGRRRGRFGVQLRVALL